MDAGSLNLRAAPPALAAGEKRTLAIAALLVALSRWPAVSRTLWDWDEALFALALRNYDVTVHHPHPPGFPLFIAIAKLIPADPFRALQIVTVAASLFVFPVMFFFARELRVPAKIALSAAAFLAFLPNVWLFGGTAFSDVPSMVLALLASALLLRGCRSDAALVAGALVLAVAAGFRPQNLLIGLVPAVMALYHRPRVAIAAALGGAAIVGASYGVAAAASGGWEPYREAVARHEHYIRTTDSFFASRHPGLVRVADDFFLRPFRAPLLNALIAILAALGLIRRRAWLALAIFGPFVIVAWLYLDYLSASRFSIAYMPLVAFLAALGIPARGRALLSALLIGLSIGWTWPALRVVHTTPAPPVAAIDAIRATYAPGTPIAVDEKLAAHADLMLTGYRWRIVRVVPGVALHPGEVLLREGGSIARGARTFVRRRDRLGGIVRQRYFEVSVIPAR